MQFDRESSLNNGQFTMLKIIIGTDMYIYIIGGYKDLDLCINIELS